LLHDSGEEAVKAFTRKIVTRISVPKECIMTGECVKVQEENNIQMLDHSSHGLRINTRHFCLNASGKMFLKKQNPNRG
jgi:hypothetical protein